MPIAFVYEPIYDDNVPIPCYFMDQIHLAYESYIGRNVKKNKKFIQLSNNAIIAKIFLKKMVQTSINT